MAPTTLHKTRFMKSHIEHLMNKTVEGRTLGKSRDQKVEGRYSTFAVVDVQRIENRTLWHIYQLKKAGMEKCSSHDAVGDLLCRSDWMAKSELDKARNELYLFHGTGNCDAIIDSITKHGLDERHGTTSGMYGGGVYLAESAGKADQYATDAKGVFTMLLCRVAFGTPYRTKFGEHWQKSGSATPKTSKLRERLAPEGYDSVLALFERGKYREFIVYDGNKVYPEFLIRYQRRGG